MTYAVSQICIIGDLTCMGCCGNTFGSAEELADAIWRNTLEFRESTDKITFKDRAEKDTLRSCGVCKNLIFSDDKMTKVKCPLHPVFNSPEEKGDLREGHCDTVHLCRAAFLYNVWDEKKKKKFVAFLLGKKLDWYTFSMGMDSNSLLEEFEKNA